MAGFTKYTHQNHPRIYKSLSPHPRKVEHPHEKIFKRTPGPMHPPVDRVYVLKPGEETAYAKYLDTLYELKGVTERVRPKTPHGPAPWGRLPHGMLTKADAIAMRMRDGVLPCQAPKCPSCRQTGDPSTDFAKLTSYHCQYDRDFKPKKVCGPNFALTQKWREEAIKEVERELKNVLELKEKKKRETTNISPTTTEDQLGGFDMNPIANPSVRKQKQMGEENKRIQEQKKLEEAIGFYSKQPRTKTAYHSKLAHWAVQRNKQIEKKFNDLAEKYREQDRAYCDEGLNSQPTGTNTETSLHRHKDIVKNRTAHTCRPGVGLGTGSWFVPQDFQTTLQKPDELRLIRRKKFPLENRSVQTASNIPVPRHHAHLFPEPIGSAASIFPVTTPTRVVSHLRVNILR